MVNYIDLAFFSSYTRTTFDGTTTPTDVYVQELIDLSNAEVEDYSGRTWDKTTGFVQYIAEPKEYQLLSGTPVLNITSIQDVNGNDISYEIVDRDLIKLDKLVPVNVTYDYGYEVTPTAVKMLATLYTLRKLIQSDSSSNANTNSITVGPISISNSVGVSAVIGLDTNIDMYEKKIRRLIV